MKKENSRVTDLIAQIEKMKCCGNCKNWIDEEYCKVEDFCQAGNRCDHWELAE